MKRSEKQVAEGILRHRIHYKRKRTVFLTSGSRKEEDVSKHRLRFLDLRYQRTNLLTWEKLLQNKSLKRNIGQLLVRF